MRTIPPTHTQPSDDESDSTTSRALAILKALAWASLLLHLTGAAWAHTSEETEGISSISAALQSDVHLMVDMLKEPALRWFAFAIIAAAIVAPAFLLFKRTRRVGAMLTITSYLIFLLYSFGNALGPRGYVVNTSAISAANELNTAIDSAIVVLLLIFWKTLFLSPPKIESDNSAPKRRRPPFVSGAILFGIFFVMPVVMLWKTAEEAPKKLRLYEDERSYLEAPEKEPAILDLLKIAKSEPLPIGHWEVLEVLKSGALDQYLVQERLNIESDGGYTSQAVVVVCNWDGALNMWSKRTPISITSVGRWSLDRMYLTLKETDYQFGFGAAARDERGSKTPQPITYDKFSSDNAELLDFIDKHWKGSREYTISSSSPLQLFLGRKTVAVNELRLFMRSTR